jgi:hypothetical protein
MNVGRIKLQFLFRILKNRWKIFHSVNAHVDQALRIMVACCVIHHYYQLMGMPLGPQIYPICGARGQVLFAHED